MQPHLERALRSVYSRDGLSHEESASSISLAAGTVPPNANRLSGSARAALPLGTSLQVQPSPSYVTLRPLTLDVRHQTTQPDTATPTTQ